MGLRLKISYFACVIPTFSLSIATFQTQRLSETDPVSVCMNNCAIAHYKAIDDVLKPLKKDAPLTPEHYQKADEISAEDEKCQ